jgi:hypothetical protein
MEEFDYTAFGNLAGEAREVAEAIRAGGVAHYIEVGDQLLAMKEKLRETAGHGHFEGWYKSEEGCGLTERRAQAYMNAAKFAAKSYLTRSFVALAPSLNVVLELAKDDVPADVLEQVSAAYQDGNRLSAERIRQLIESTRRENKAAYKEAEMWVEWLRDDATPRMRRLALICALASLPANERAAILDEAVTIPDEPAEAEQDEPEADANEPAEADMAVAAE